MIGALHSNSYLHLGCPRPSLRLMISKPHERTHVQHRTRSELKTANEEHASPQESKIQEARLQQTPPDGAKLRMGQLMLVVVALLWGTYSPAVRYITVAIDSCCSCALNTHLHFA